MPLHGFFLRARRLATWLSLLALCSALLAPASVLAKELRDGQWIGLCGAGLSAGQGGHDACEDGHCGLCALPGWGMPPSPLKLIGRGSDPQALRAPAHPAPGLRPEHATIRGPPSRA